MGQCLSRRESKDEDRHRHRLQAINQRSTTTNRHHGSAQQTLTFAMSAVPVKLVKLQPPSQSVPLGSSSDASSSQRASTSGSNGVNPDLAFGSRLDQVAVDGQPIENLGSILNDAVGRRNVKRQLE